MIGKPKTSLLLLFLFGLAAGCATRPVLLPAPGESGTPADEMMIAVEGYSDGSDFFVKYRFENDFRYAGGSWQDRIKLIEPAPEEGARYAVPSLVPMTYHQTYPWKSLPKGKIAIPIFSVAQWQLLRNQLLRSVVPDTDSGLVINFGDAEYFLYYDRQGDFQATRFTEKPSDYRVHEILRFDEFMTRGRPVLDAFLQEQGITQTEFVFNTGDTGLYSLPFLYVNTNRRLLVFVRNVPIHQVTTTPLPGLKQGQAFGHVMHSHLTNLLLRPVSSLYRLFFVITDSTVSTMSLDWTTALSNQPVGPLSNAAPMDLGEWEHDLDRISLHPVDSGEVDILVDGEAFFTRFVDQVSSARESVNLQTYIFDNDDYAVRIADLLKRKSGEGVEVKVLLDGIGTISSTMTDSASQPESHRPPASVRLMLKSGSRIKVRQKANPWFTGDHVKATIIDHEVAYVGGMNIGREYRYDWHDLMMEIRGPVVDTINHEFDLAWTHAGPWGDLGYVIAQAKKKRRREAETGYPLRLLLTGPGNYEIYQAQRDAIRRAQSYIFIQNAYFTDDSLLRELVMARRRGVDVRVVIPMETDHGPITRSNVLAANLMLENGIRVFIYPGFSHVKAAIYDGWSCLGSANFDRLSLRINRELNIASSEPEVARQLLERLFEPDFRHSPELTEPIPDRWVDYLVEIVGDYLY